TGYGVFGPRTRAAANLLLSGVSVPTTTPLPAVSGVYNFTRDLTIDSEGEDVRQLQIYLNTRGFQVALSGVGSPGNETTHFGNFTKVALIKFQVSKGIVPTSGYFGNLTRSAIKA